MRLLEYLKANSITGAEFAKGVNIDRTKAHRLITGKQRPSDDELMQAIIDFTEGQVTANDFYNLQIEEKPNQNLTINQEENHG